MQPATVPVGAPICSARGCRSPARWALQWNNPRLHPAERRKTWMACEQHRASLSEFLEVRGFLRETLPAPDAVVTDDAAPGPARPRQA